jgi:hypothetical protein
MCLPGKIAVTLNIRHNLNDKLEKKITRSINTVTYTRYVCGSVTKNNTWIRIGYRIY